VREWGLVNGSDLVQGWACSQGGLMARYSSNTATALGGALVLSSVLAVTPLAAEDACPSADKPIATDRPDVTNSSLVVPFGSFQNENGVNATLGGHFAALDGTNSRLRLGVAPCLEVLVDLPNYTGRFKSGQPSGFSDVTPAIKWQVSPDPGKFDLSLVAGVGLGTGNRAITGGGTQPYIQLPWSYELKDGWGVSGMFTSFFRPSDQSAKQTTETTLSLEKELREDLSVFVEYVGDFPDTGRNQQLMNSGMSWHVTKLQQLDMRLAFGLNNNSPDMIVGVGYSFRVDGLFK